MGFTITRANYSRSIEEFQDRSHLIDEGLEYGIRYNGDPLVRKGDSGIIFHTSVSLGTFLELFDMSQYALEPLIASENFPIHRREEKEGGDYINLEEFRLWLRTCEDGGGYIRLKQTPGASNPAAPVQL